MPNFKFFFSCFVSPSAGPFSPVGSPVSSPVSLARAGRGRPPAARGRHRFRTRPLYCPVTPPRLRPRRRNPRGRGRGTPRMPPWEAWWHLPWPLHGVRHVQSANEQGLAHCQVKEQVSSLMTVAKVPIFVVPGELPSMHAILLLLPAFPDKQGIP